jgi:hypothetical protein
MDFIFKLNIRLKCEEGGVFSWDGALEFKILVVLDPSVNPPLEHSTHAITHPSNNIVEGNKGQRAQIHVRGNTHVNFSFLFFVVGEEA